MGKRRNTQLDLCFDSMSDLITNLAGGLVLVVLLLMAVTREAPKPVSPVAAGAAETGDQSTYPLYKRLSALKVEVGQAEADLAEDRAELQRLEAAVASLLDPKKSAPAPPDKK